MLPKSNLLNMIACEGHKKKTVSQKNATANSEGPFAESLVGALEILKRLLSNLLVIAS